MTVLARVDHDVNRFAIASNASLADADMLSHTIPSWMRVFGDRLAEITIVVDDEPLAGRIAELHSGLQDKQKIDAVLQELGELNSRIKYRYLSELPITEIQQKWFGVARPSRCQMGAPILPFVAAIECVSTDLVLRCDSDMLFFEAGWLNSGLLSLKSGAVDIYEPPRIIIDDNKRISSRAFMVSRSRFSTKLPLKHLYVDFARRVYRHLQGRPAFIGLEAMLEQSIVREELLSQRGTAIDEAGWSVHALKRAFANEPWFANAVGCIEHGSVPDLQRQSWNLNPEAWSDCPSCEPN